MNDYITTDTRLNYLENPLDLYTEVIDKMEGIGYYICFGDEVIFDLIDIDLEFLEATGLMEVCQIAKQAYLESTI